MSEAKDIMYYDNNAHLLQLYVHRHSPKEEFHQHGEWELPEGATVRPMRGGEEAIELPNGTHGRTHGPCSMDASYGRSSKENISIQRELRIRLPGYFNLL